MVRKITLGPVNRVEGELEVQLELSQGRIEAAYVKSTLYRGFENLLTGKNPMDALAITPRICGICSVSQSVASARAIADLAQVQMPANGERVTNIILATEVVTDLLTHFYLFFMPDFSDSAYNAESWSKLAAQRFTAIQGERHSAMLKARAEFLHIMGILAGKWPHSLVFQPGGVSKTVTLSEQLKLKGIVTGFRAFLESVLFGDRLENIGALDSVNALNRWQQEHAEERSDFALFLAISESLDLQKAGSSYNHFLAYPAFNVAGTEVYSGGTYIDNQRKSVDTKQISEHLDSAWLIGDQQHPSEGLTEPYAEKQDAYTWCKAPRYEGKAIETGSIARQFLAKDALASELVNASGSNIHNRIVLRLMELAKLVIQIENWIGQIKPAEAFCNQTKLPKKGQGVGLSEAARGALGHWLSVENGIISNYQLIAPTSWNFSPRDNQGQPGPLEYALKGLEYDSPQGKLMMQHIIRSFDPCMVCTVH
ncbi:nickel-dependent hydrogenase large subunit [Motiliproteus sp. MSK22-1]|uniref:nickel-dependent hydrogenase large subunit n=1 Tax=Motiliproteus sp. MSK22-1 TaxID=1897630 RepID=UPI000976A6AB|nr:nickel-dependent hydrogenase large subunit [Motiliproteus sp. MSK22-1]OMH32096.1 hypothetical protein BGP75_15445 [Motiliproteus sp. MSK22-1]